MIDKVLGPYRVLDKLGEGGMGQVYRARDTKLNRDVALKVLPPSVAGNPDALARFRREAQVLAALNHPNIAALHGFEDFDSTSVLVMELVPGATLDELIKAQTTLPLETVLDIGRQIALALETAHELGIVHRDLKPANIKIREDGVVKVLDFGLAKALASESAGATADPMNSPTLTGRATQLGMIMGTAAYMAPEQAKGRAVDRRADIWAFGVVLYEMLTGQRGYDAEDLSETLAAVLTREVDWNAIPATTPARLSLLVRDCLVRDPRQRLRDIGEARRTLERLIAGTPDAADSSPSVVKGAAVSRGRQVVPWAVAALAIAIAAVAGWRAWRTPEPPSAAVVTRARFSHNSNAGFVTLSRDGTKIVYSTLGNEGFMLYLRQVDQFDSKPIAGTANAAFAVLSPDGAWLAFSGNGNPDRIRKIPTSGGTPVVLADGNFQHGADWGPDDTIVYGGGNGLRRLPAAGGAPEALTTIDAAKGEAAHIRPQFLPRDRELLFTIAYTNAPGRFALLNLATKQYDTIAPGGASGRYLASGHLTFVRDRVLYAVPYDLASRSATGPEVPVVEGVSTLGPAGMGDYAVAATGLLVYTEASGVEGTTLVWVDRKGAVQPIAGQVPRLWSTGRLSPDGRYVANAIGQAGPQLGNGQDIWVMDLERGAATRVTSAGVNDRPIWTADGRDLIYRGGQDGRTGLYRVAADGSRAPSLILATSVRANPSSLSPDGKTLFFQQEARIFVVNLGPDGAAAGAPRRFRESSASEGAAEVSPNGAWVAFASSESGTSEVYIMPLAGSGGRTRVSIDGAGASRWSKDGSELYFWSSPGGRSSLMSATVRFTPALSVGAPVALFEGRSGTTWGPAPDGKRFLIERLGQVSADQITPVTSFALVTNWFDELKRRAPPKPR